MTNPPDSLERFHRRALANPALLDHLCAQTDMDAFIRRMVEAGAEHGERFTADDVRAVLGNRRSEWLQRIML